MARLTVVGFVDRRDSLIPRLINESEGEYGRQIVEQCQHGAYLRPQNKLEFGGEKHYYEAGAMVGQVDVGSVANIRGIFIGRNEMRGPRPTPGS